MPETKHISIVDPLVLVSELLNFKNNTTTGKKYVKLNSYSDRDKILTVIDDYRAERFDSIRFEYPKFVLILQAECGFTFVNKITGFRFSSLPISSINPSKTTMEKKIKNLKSFVENFDLISDSIKKIIDSSSRYIRSTLPIAKIMKDFKYLRMINDMPDDFNYINYDFFKKVNKIHTLEFARIGRCQTFDWNGFHQAPITIRNGQQQSLIYTICSFDILHYYLKDSPESVYSFNMKFMDPRSDNSLKLISYMLQQTRKYEDIDAALSAALLKVI